jgi:hypothetical protein
MNVAHAVHESSIGRSTRNRNGGRSLKGVKERIQPPREFRCPNVLDRIFHLEDQNYSRELYSPAVSIEKGARNVQLLSRRGRTNRAATKRHWDRRAHHVEQHPNTSGSIKPLELTHEIGKGPRKDSH